MATISRAVPEFPEKPLLYLVAILSTDQDFTLVFVMFDITLFLLFRGKSRSVLNNLFAGMRLLGGISDFISMSVSLGFT